MFSEWSGEGTTKIRTTSHGHHITAGSISHVCLLQTAGTQRMFSRTFCNSQRVYFCILALQRRKTHAHGMFYGRTTQLALSLKHEVQSFYKCKHTSTKFLKSLKRRIQTLSKKYLFLSHVNINQKYSSKFFKLFNYYNKQTSTLSLDLDHNLLSLFYHNLKQVLRK
jgi:hypothetical protein